MNLDKQFCCRNMMDNSSEELQIVHYSRIFDEYSIPIPEDDSIMLMRYCPWCGKELPRSKRDEWVDQLEALGFEDPFFRDDIPEAFKSDAWRK